MDNKKKKELFLLIVAIAVIILIGVGSTFAFFSANVASEEGAVDVGAAVFEIALKDDSSLSKSNIIPSKEKYVIIQNIEIDNTIINVHKNSCSHVNDKPIIIINNTQLNPSNTSFLVISIYFLTFQSHFQNS